MESFDLRREFVVLDPDKRAVRVANSPRVYAQLGEQFGDFRSHELIAVHAFEGDWPSWEIHPHGDEVVVLLAGSANFVLDIDGTHREIGLGRVGQAVVVPRGVWHTAHIVEAATLLFITPGEGTENRYL